MIRSKTEEAQEQASSPVLWVHTWFDRAQLVYIHWNPYIHQHSSPLWSTTKQQCRVQTDKESVDCNDHKYKSVEAMAQPSRLPVSFINFTSKLFNFNKKRRKWVTTNTVKSSLFYDVFVFHARKVGLVGHDIMLLGCFLCFFCYLLFDVKSLQSYSYHLLQNLNK